MPAVHLDEKNFERLVLEEKHTALVDFWAPWCGPCRMLAPVIEEIAEQVPQNILVAKVDTDQESALAVRYGVMSIPTVISFRDGKEHQRVTGLTSKEALMNLLE